MRVHLISQQHTNTQRNKAYHLLQQGTFKGERVVHGWLWKDLWDGWTTLSVEAKKLSSADVWWMSLAVKCVQRNLSYFSSRPIEELLRELALSLTPTLWPNMSSLNETVLLFDNGTTESLFTLDKKKKKWLKVSETESQTARRNLAKYFVMRFKWQKAQKVFDLFFSLFFSRKNYFCLQDFSLRERTHTHTHTHLHNYYFSAHAKQLLNADTSVNNLFVKCILFSNFDSHLQNTWWHLAWTAVDKSERL